MPLANIFKSIILDTFMRDGLITTTATIAGFALGPVVIGGVVRALGFGEDGIAAGSIAAWHMSLHRGTVAAGSLVANLQSIGAAGLGVGGFIVAGLGGILFYFFGFGFSF
nr:2399_t:CDS:2 [Entrophospora candida]